MNPVFLTERKDALTEEMNALIDAVVKQHQATEGSEPNKAKNGTEKPNRKRKLQLNNSENKTEKSATSDKKKRDGGDEKEKKSKAKRKTTGERKENQPTQTKTSTEKRRRSPRHRLPRKLPYVFLTNQRLFRIQLHHQLSVKYRL